jgi:hypothetical protein
MRGLVIGLVLVSNGFLCSRARADEADEARAIVKEAVEAHGGERAMAKMLQVTRSSSGTLFLFGQEIPFQDEMILQLPSRWRWTIETGPAGQRSKSTMIVNGANGWNVSGIASEAIPKERLDEMRAESVVLWLATLVPLLQDKDLQLGLAKETQISGQAAKGIRVTPKGLSEVRIYFDPKTHLLAKIERRARQAGLDIDKEYQYGEYKASGGAMLPRHYSEWSNGKKLVDVGTITYRFDERPDDKLFEKP